jgi:hypothetical protein
MTNKYKEPHAAAIEEAFSPKRGFFDPMTVPRYREIFERGDKQGVEKGIEKSIDVGMEKSIETLKAIGAPPEIVEAYVRKMKNEIAQSKINGNAA